MDKKGLIFIRNSDFRFDSRMQREANTALKLGIEVTALSWLREKALEAPATYRLTNGQVNIRYYKRLTSFGLGLKNIMNLLRYNLWIFRQLQQLKDTYDTLHACDLDIVLPAYAIAKLYKKKLIYDIFDMYAQTHSMPAFFKTLVQRLEYKILSLVDVVIVCNEVREKQIRGSKPKRAFVIHNTPDMSFAKSQKSIIEKDSDRFKIVYTGTLSAEGRLLREICEAAPRFKKMELHVAGVGPLAEYFMGMAQCNDNIFFYGHISIGEALQLESECDLLFATYDPSVTINKYSAPNKLSEAMAFSKPIIACKGTGADQIVSDHHMGVVIDYDADQFWDVANDLAGNHLLCKEMGLNGLKAYDHLYSWEIMEQRLKKLYCAL